MIKYYNAFISYKHADLDNKVAAEIVKGLEHYHIPGKIRKQTGVKKIDRIFRDKDELPITNDLNDTIAEALKNADYLIVICSTNTKKSTWVEKEIETFLKNHTMGQVLTVLADGEPYDVIPKVLLTSKKEVTDENGETHVVEVPLEPLSCDFRLPIKKARAEELPRLAAALIGCSYDELMNRHRQYKMRRLTAIFAGAMALMLGFTGYMLYSNTLIHKNYIESLRSKSKYLANESLKQLDDENRIEAMQLALEALPKDENDETPVTPEALKAITWASLSYETLRGSNITSAWNYDMSNNIRKFQVSNDGSKLVAEDTGNTITVWDTATHQVILNFVDSEFNDFFFFDNDTLLITSYDALKAYDLKTGELMWRNEDWRINENLFPYTGKSFLVPSTKGGVSELSIENGSELKNFDLQILDDKISMDYATNYALSDDKKKLAFSIGTGTNEEHSYYNKDYTLYEYNLETGELKSYYLGEDRINHVDYLDNKLYVSTSKTGMDGSQKLYDYIYTTEDHYNIFCFSSGDLDLLWQYDFICTNVAYTSGFKALTGKKMAFFAGNRCCAWDNETGELQLDHNTNESIMTVHDSGKELAPTYITRGGYMAYGAKLSDSSQGISSSKRFTDDLTDVIVNKGVYTHKELSHTIVFYGSTIFDDQWTKFDRCPTYNSACTQKMSGDCLAIVADNDDGGSDMMIFDVNEKKYKTTFHISDDVRYTKVNVLGTYDKKLYYMYEESDSDTFNDHLILCTYDLITSENTIEDLNADYSSYEIGADLHDNKLIYFNNHKYESAGIMVKDLSTGKEKEVSVGELNFYYCNYFKYIPEANTVFMTGGTYDEPQYKIINLDTENVYDVSLPKDWGKPVDVTIDEDNKRFAITNGEEILLKSMEGDLISEISCNNTQPMGMVFHNFKDLGNLLIVPYLNGTMYRYNGETGDFVGKSDLTTYSNNYGYKAEFEFDDDANLMYVQEESVLNMFELDSWIETAYILGCYGHHAATDTFITYSYEKSSEYELGYFKHYSTQDLIDKTKTYLQGVEMAEDQKSMYGIG